MATTPMEIIVRAVVRRDGRLLLARERSTSWLFLPGGHIEPGERVEAALLREIAEELGTAASIVRFLGVVENGYADPDGTPHHELNLVFEVMLADPEPAGQEGHLDFHWLPLDLLADADVRPAALRDALLAGHADTAGFWHAWPG